MYDDDKKSRRRNCADRMRAELMVKKIHRRRRVDPAMSVAIQFMALFSVGLRLLPEFPMRAPPAPAPVLPVPTVLRTVPEPGEVWQRYKATPSWSLLVKDLARPAATSDAQQQVRARLPVECAPWLDYIFREEDWSALRIHVRSGSPNTDVAIRVLSDARRWYADQKAARTSVLGEPEQGGSASVTSPGKDGDRGMRF